METTTTTQSLELFLTALIGQNYSPKTLRAYSDDLRQFIEWVGENRVDWDHPRRFTRADVEGFMSYLAGQHMTGIRLSELASLRLEDLDFDNKVLTVRQGKGKKDRQIPLVDEAVKALRNYLRFRNSQLVLDDEIIFLAKNGTSLNVSTVKYTVAKYVKQAGIRKKVGVHTLRHTFGAHKADKHMGIATLQQVMGHKKKETTLKYIHLARTNLRQEMSETVL